ncbi:hypothetical protein LWI29_028684 [Acer saccharum]|uniref:Enoyl reductase (ER) domain-containing protein n=1 Tax=Acer saccharum TaxID=4024 RepID=A0AA39WAY6_ACESA|nr:hypothetical protein LWI29_028684 [Acer saccharum]
MRQSEGGDQGDAAMAVGSEDVSLKITHCGVCYGDVIYTKNKHGDSMYPVVPGHEIVGIVNEVGGNVERFKAGDHVAVGSYVNSCRDCEECNEGLEVYCSKKLVPTFNSIDEDGTVTKVYTPMMHHKMNQPGKSLGVVGLGGLGHMAVLFGKAFGLHVTVFSTSASKKEEALNLLGADNFVLSTDEHQMKGMTRSLDFIVDSASGNHSFYLYLSLLKTKGVLALVGYPNEIKLTPHPLLSGMRSISGSWTGGTRQTQEMLDFCGVHKIYPQIEIIPIQYAYEAFERMMKNDVKYRFVIDIENSLK